MKLLITTINGFFIGFFIADFFFPTIQEVVRVERTERVQEVCIKPLATTTPTISEAFIECTPDIRYEPVYIKDERCLEDLKKASKVVRDLQGEIAGWRLSCAKK